VRARGRMDLSDCGNQSSEDTCRWSQRRRRLPDQLYRTDNFRCNSPLLNLHITLKTNVLIVGYEGK
jgi:hypothetical protein